MSGSGHLWAVVLAAGDGTRVRALTTDASGAPIPKQYCSFGGAKSMLRWALERATALVPPERVVAIVAHQHRGFWEKELADLPVENVVVQPRNRGTAAGVLLPVLHVLLRRDPHATFLVLPSDHYVADEETLREAMIEAIHAARPPDDRLVLLGFQPQEFDPEYGWIVSSPTDDASVRTVASFLEKPNRETAVRLARGGALLNSFMFVAHGGPFLRMCEKAVPSLLKVFVSALREQSWPRALEQAYEGLPTSDFSRDVLERATEFLPVISVPPCGWSDLGTPARITLFREALDPSGPKAPRPGVCPAEVRPRLPPAPEGRILRNQYAAT